MNEAQTDETLIKMFWERDESAPAAAAEAYGSYCYAVAMGILGSPPDAEECVNDTWLRVWEAIPPAKPERMRPYLAKITRRLALDRLDHLNAAKRGKGEAELVLSELSDSFPGPMDAAEEAELHELGACISRFLRTIPEKHANVFIRRCFYMEPVKAISKRFGITPGYSALILARTRKKLKDHLIKEEFIRE